MRTDPARRFDEERALVVRGFRRLAGVDEAGRGPLAGPVVVAAVMFPLAWIEGGLPETMRGLTDSKQLSAGRREAYFEELSTAEGVGRCVVVVGAEEIDQVNILRATHLGMVRAVGGLDPGPDHVLVDGLEVVAIPGPQTALVKGDARSYSIAAASVLAKVTRDRWMADADRRWPEYGFGVHKGYPTPGHLAALARHGPCPIHRRSFAPVAAAASQPDLFGG